MGVLRKVLNNSSSTDKETEFPPNYRPRPKAAAFISSVCMQNIVKTDSLFDVFRHFENIDMTSDKSFTTFVLLIKAYF